LEAPTLKIARRNLLQEGKEMKKPRKKVTPRIIIKTGTITRRTELWIGKGEDCEGNPAHAG